jgi:galactoside O-acetyltransferase
MAWLTEAQISAMGFLHVGKRVRLSERASFYNCANIRIDDDSRIDDFAILSAGAGGIAIGRYVHVAAFSSLIGAGKITLSDFSGLSSRVSVYSSNEDYGGGFLTNPTVPPEYTNVMHAPVALGRHAIIGAGSIILPGVTIEDGVAVGAMSLIRKDCQAFGVYVGVPAKRVAERKRDLLQLEAKLEAERAAK